MKKNLIYAGMLLLGMTVATSCSNEESLEQVWNDGNTVQAVIENLETRTSVSDDYKVLWTTGDQFDVWNGDIKAGVLELKSGDGTVSGTFGLPTDANVFEVAEGMTAFFPTNATADAKTYTFATSYPSQETDAPMLGTFADGKFTFSLLTAMVRVTVTDVPQGEAVLTISSTNETLTGEATLSGDALEVSSNGGKEVTVTVQNDAVGTLTFDVPVPAQSYSAGLSVVLKVGNAEVFSKTTNAFTAEKGKIYVFGTAMISGKDALMAAFENGGDVTLTDDVTLTEAVTIASGKSVTIDLNGKTLTLSETTATNPSDDITNNGSLTFKNGTIKSANTAIYSTKDATSLTLVNCDVSTSDQRVNTVSAYGGEFTIVGGSYKNTATTFPNAAVYVIAIDNRYGGTTTGSISGADIEVSSQNQGAVTVLGAANSNTTLSIDGGTYKAGYWHALYLNNATVNYQNATFEGGDSWSDIFVATDGGTINGQSYSGNSSINI